MYQSGGYGGGGPAMGFGGPMMGGGGFGGGAGGGFPPRRRPRQDGDDFTPAKSYRPVDTFSSSIRYVQTRLQHKNTAYQFHVPHHEYYAKDLIPVFATPQCPATALCTHLVTAATHPTNPTRTTFTCLKWSPNGRRLLSATADGEFILFSGHSFGVETKTVAHEKRVGNDNRRSCKALAWGRVTDLIVSGDDQGTIKMWLPNFVAVAEFSSNRANKGVTEISWSPTERKFVTAGEDATARIWDTEVTGGGGGHNGEEMKLEGHENSITTVDWHPFRGLIATGSLGKDIRLWDPRTANTGSVLVMQGHSEAVTCVRWHAGGNYFLSGGRDFKTKIWDIRVGKETSVFQGPTARDVSKVCWHPTHTDLFATASADGIILYWTMAENAGKLHENGVYDVMDYADRIDEAHGIFSDKNPNRINDIAFSPTGHVLSSCSGDVRIWRRNKPGASEQKHTGAEDEFFQS